jgi:N utilization substance protein B
MSGTRRKARECALQILFAADLLQAQPGELSRRYWSEFGFDELHSGASRTAKQILLDLDKIEVELSDVKKTAAKIVALAPLVNLPRDIKDISALTDSIRREYAKQVDRFIDENLLRDDSLVPMLYDLSGNLTLLFGAIRELLGNDRNAAAVEERIHIREHMAECEQAYAELTGQHLPAMDKLLRSLSGGRDFTDRLATGTLTELKTVDERIMTRAEHWRIERMALVDRNILRLAVYEMLNEETPYTVVINEALEIARRFSTFEATQFINGILDAIKQDLEAEGKLKPGGEPVTMEPATDETVTDETIGAESVTDESVSEESVSDQ